jgi:hypothetical protein
MQAVININTGLVKRFIADIHPDWVDPEGYLLVNAEPPPEGGWQMEPKPPREPEPTVLTKLEFRNRFTMAERVVIDNAADNPELPVLVRHSMRTILADFASAEDVRPGSEQVGQALGAFVSFGFLAPERVAEITAP